MFSLVLTQVAVYSNALRAPGPIDPRITHIDVRMEDLRAEQLGANVASDVAMPVAAPLATASGTVKPAAFLSSVVTGGPLDSIVGVLQSAPVHLGKPNAQVQAASAVMREVAAEVGPTSPFLGREFDPDISNDLLFCDHDYAQSCPDGFASVGGASCAPLASYDGPCVSEARSFSGLPAAAKERWSMQCAASWPCKECIRDFAAPCPQGWLEDAAGATCSTAAGYAGPCSGPISFSGYNVEMLQWFSSSCGAFWACVQ